MKITLTRVVALSVILAHGAFEYHAAGAVVAAKVVLHTVLLMLIGAAVQRERSQLTLKAMHARATAILNDMARQATRLIHEAEKRSQP